jgi:hypothetical protein
MHVLKHAKLNNFKCTDAHFYARELALVSASDVVVAEGDDLNWHRYVAGSLLGEIGEGDSLNWHRNPTGILLGDIGEGGNLNWHRYLAGSLLGEISKGDDPNWHKHLAGSLLGEIGKGDDLNLPLVALFCHYCRIRNVAI